MPNIALSDARVKALRPRPSAYDTLVAVPPPARG